MLGLQHADGWWQSEFETNVTMDAEDLLLREFLGLHDDEVIAATARWIRSSSGTTAPGPPISGGPGDLSTTVEAYLALRLAGDEPDAPHMKQACDWIIGAGGVEATRVFTRIWLALSGLWSWDDLPVIPPEMIYMPSWLPLNIYDWACWARQTIVALAVLQSFSPSRPLPFTIDELRTGVTPRRPPADTWARVFAVLDKALHHYRPVKSVRRAALRRCADWIIARQERDGSWGGIQPPWVYSLMALNLLGYDVSHPVMARGLAGLDRFTITEDTADGPMRTFDACQGPVWGTALMMVALSDAGLPPDHPALVDAARWVLGEEIRGPGGLAGAQAGAGPGQLVGSRSRTTSTPTTMTPRKSCSRCDGSVPRTPQTSSAVGSPSLACRLPSSEGCDGWPGCSQRTAAGARSTRTTRASSSRSRRSATSVRSSTRRRRT